MSKSKGGERSSDSVAREDLVVELEKIGSNTRRIQSRISINASLEAIWSILTYYDKLSDILPGIAVSKLLEKRGNCARVHQIAQQNLPLGFKFTAKTDFDSYEKEIEILANGRKREIEFKMVDGDFQVCEGKWSIEQLDKPKSEKTLDNQEFASTLSYSIDLKPKPWLPFHLIEGRLCKEIKTNLACVREEAHRRMKKTLTM